MSIVKNSMALRPRWTGEGLLHPANLGTDISLHLMFLQINSGILLHHLLQCPGATGTAAFADDEFVHRVSDGLDDRRPLLPFLRRAALTFVLLELDYAQAYATDKESVDEEGALTAPAAANVEALWLAALDLVFLPNTEILSNDSGDQLVEICASVLADLQNDFVHCVRQEICRDQNLPTAASEFRL